MGLNVIVGVGGAAYNKQFAAINTALRAIGLPPHIEPENPPSPLPKEFELYGYTGLHYLRRIAAYLIAGEKLPPPGDESAPEDDVLLQCYEDQDVELHVTPDGMVGQPGTVLEFDHLMTHSDAEGYYIPVDFDRVIHTSPIMHIGGQFIGSSKSLMSECERLAKALELPLDLDPDSEEVQSAPEDQGIGDGWRKYGIEALTCLSLYHAARLSISHRCAMIFN